MKLEEGSFCNEGYDYHFTCISDIGRVRKSNEDDFLTAPFHNIVGVADGVGGLSGGEIASNIACEAVCSFFDASSTTTIWDKFLSISRKQKAIGDKLTKAIAEANRQVFQVGSRENNKIATTIVLANFTGGFCSVAHVGDSRLYQFRGDHLSLLTKDHTVAQELASQSPGQANQINSGFLNNVITRAVGAKPEVEVDCCYRPVKDQDRFLICSDGLTSMVSDEEIQQILVQEEDISMSTIKLVEAANLAGGRDNITVILVGCSAVTCT